MTAAAGFGPDHIFWLRPRRRRSVFRPFLWAMFWAVLGFATWAAVRIMLLRPQPDAIATSVPGFLSRLVLRPLEALMHGAIGVDPGLPALQIAAVVIIFTISMHIPQCPTKPLRKGCG